MNLESEYRKGYHVSSEMKQLWNVEFQLLKKLLDVCDEYHLKIWAHGGTLLGTIREGGFIPWDDDIDVEMPREDYDKLWEIAPKVFRKPFYFQSGYTDVFPSGFSRLCMNGTAYVAKRYVLLKFHHNIAVDIFPLDLLPDKDDERIQFIKQTKLLKEKLWEYCEPQYSLVGWNYNLRLLKNKVNTVLIGGFKSLYREYDNHIKQYKNTDSNKVSPISTFVSDKYTRNRDWYDETLFMPFEDILVPVPLGYKDILVQHYGIDYMVPKQVSSGHGDLIYVSTTKSYKVVIPFLRMKCRKDKLKKDVVYLLKYIKAWIVYKSNKRKD